MQTIIPCVFRSVKGVVYARERITTFDQDFLDLDWSCFGAKRLAIISHGLEGDTYRPYMLGMVKELNADGWDTLAWNFRGCSGELNSKSHYYHAGSTDDLKAVIKHAVDQNRYTEIVLIGFSLGGNIILKYLGDEGSSIPSLISKAITISVPCDLYSCVQELKRRTNFIYLYNFMSTLKAKMAKKAELFPEILSGVDLSKINDLVDFDNHFTAPLSGFRDAYHYYSECSSTKSIEGIRIPVLLINAQNDPFLRLDFLPVQECKKSKWVTLEAPANGGHMGFVLGSLNDPLWSEKRALDFLKFSM